MDEFKSKLKSDIKNIYLYMFNKDIETIILNDDNLSFKSKSGDTWTIMKDEIAYIISDDKE